MDAERRSMVRKVGAVIGVGALAAPVVVSAVRPAPLATEAFASIDAALRTFAQLKTATPRMQGAWDLPRVLHHAAQSIEYSMTGFPALKPAWFRTTLGPYAFALFDARGAMSHDLADPIPGAPAIAQGQSLPAAIDRASAALRAFDAHTGALQPHFAYGALDKTAYTRAHLMHLANHWTEAVAA
jgi:hypothetical protein